MCRHAVLEVGGSNPGADQWEFSFLCESIGTFAKEICKEQYSTITVLVASTNDLCMSISGIQTSW